MGDDRSSVAAQRATITVDGRSYSGWQTVTYPDHDLPTGTYAPAGAKGVKTTVGTVRQGGDYVLTKKFDRAQFGRLKNPRDPASSMVVHEVDTDERILSTIGRTTGVVKGITPSGLDRMSGDPLMMVMRYTADGEVG